MNCIKCPILEECEASKMTVQSIYPQGISVTTVAVPVDIAECPLLKAIAKANELSET